VSFALREFDDKFSTQLWLTSSEAVVGCSPPVHAASSLGFNLGAVTRDKAVAGVRALRRAMIFQRALWQLLLGPIVCDFFSFYSVFSPCSRPPRPEQVTRCLPLSSRTVCGLNCASFLVLNPAAFTTTSVCWRPLKLLLHAPLLPPLTIVGVT